MYIIYNIEVYYMIPQADSIPAGKDKVSIFWCLFLF